MIETPIESGTVDLKPAGTLVYVVRDWGGAVCYVGMTDDLCQRMARHRGDSGWWPEAQRVDWELWPDRTGAARREAVLIQEHRPSWNVHMNGDPRPKTIAPSSWRNLGEHVRAARVAQRRTQSALAEAVGMEVRLLRRLELGDVHDLGVGQLTRLEGELDWAAGSVVATLDGGEPRPLSPEERSERAVAAGHAFHAGSR